MDVKVEDAGVCRKKLSITIPRDEISKKFDERFTELEREATVPGFRPGRAPRRLIEKRFREAVAEEVRVALAAESLQQALQGEELDVLGEPDIDPDAIELPDEGDMTFSLEVEVRPEFQLTDYAGIPVDVARESVTDTMVKTALERMRESHATIEPIEADGEAAANDLVTADLAVQMGEEVLVDRQHVRLPVAAVAVEGIPLPNLADLLTGAKGGETKTGTVTVGEDADREELAGKEVEVRVKIDAIDRIVKPDDKALLERAGYESMEALKASLERQLGSQSELAHRRRQEQAVEEWLLENMPFELPEALAKRHANRLLQRRLVDLQYRGVPVEELEKRMDQIRGATTEQAARDLKLHFILDRIGKQEKVEASDAEVDARVGYIAAQYGRRADRLQDEMAEQGSLDSLRSQIREEKVMRMLLSKARIAGAEADAAQEKSESAAADADKGREDPAAAADDAEST